MLILPKIWRSTTRALPAASRRREGLPRYWLHAMQVSALRGKFISGMLVRPLAESLKEVCVGKHNRGLARAPVSK
jgi:hypothetical protein